MYIYKIIVSVALIISLYATSTKVIADPLEIVQPNQMTIQGQIEHYSKLYNVDSALVSKVIQCESDGKINAVGDSGRSIGIAQFQKPTFKSLSSKLGEELDYSSSHDQIKLLSYSLANGFGKNWTAYRAIMNGGTYSFYSFQLKKHYVVKCKL